MAKLFIVKGRIFYEDSTKLSLLNGSILKSTAASAVSFVNIVIQHFRKFIGGM